MDGKKHVIKIGDPILIPKGTRVFDYGHADAYGTVSKRSSRSTVKQLITLDWTWFINYHLGDRWMRAGITRHWPVREGFVSSHPEVVAEKARIDAMLGQDYQFVVWGERYAHVSSVQLTEAPKGKEAKVTKRTIMVKGSQWRFNRDVTITGMAHPERDHRLSKELKAWLEAGKPYDYNDPFRYCREVPIFTIKKGTEFTITGDKMASSSRQKPTMIIRTNLQDDQLEFHIKYLRSDGSTGGRGMPGWQYWGENPWWVGEHGLPFSQVEDAIDVIEVPETLIYLLKDTATGKYFAGFHDDYSDWHNPVFAFKMSDTVKSAKKFTNPSNAQSSIKSWTGHLEKLGVQSDTVSTTKKAELPDTWVMVPVNKITLEEGNEIDIQSWYRSL